MVREVLKDVLTSLPEDTAFFHSACTKGLPGFVKGDLIQRLNNIVEQRFKRVSYTEAVEILCNSTKRFTIRPAWGEDLATEHERYLTEEVFGGPVIVYNYPKGIKAFYMRLNDDNKTVAAMDVLVPRCGEIIGGSQREERPAALLRRMAEIGLDPAGLDWYVDLRRYGGVPHAGFGLGFERLILLASGLENIRDAIPFPRFPGHALC